MGVLFTITLRQLTLRSSKKLRGFSFCLGMRVTPLGFCLRVKVNEKPLNLKKTTSNVRSVLLLIYAVSNQIIKHLDQIIIFPGFVHFYLAILVSTVRREKRSDGKFKNYPAIFCRRHHIH